MTNKVVVWLISEKASSDFNGGAYEQEDLLPLFYPRHPRDLVLHLKLRSTAAPLAGSPRSDFVWGGGKKPRYRPREIKPRPN